MKSIRASLFLVFLGIAFIAKAETMANPKVTIETNHGTIVLELFEADAPITVKNFLKHVDTKFYDGLVFHRVIKGFMIQAGGFDGDMQERSSEDLIVNESSNGLSNTTGTVAMARRSDPDSAAAQFYINTADNVSLDYQEGKQGYAVFGRVVAGMEVVRAIEDLPTTSHGMHRDVPENLPRIVSAKRYIENASN